MILRLLGPQGIAGLAASLCLALLLVLQKGETRHWKKQSGQYQQLYAAEQAKLAGTIANYRAEADAARAADRANAEQRAVNQRTQNDLEARLAAARAAAHRLRVQAQPAAAHSGRGGAAPMPGLSAAAGGPAQASGEDRLPASAEELDWRLTATEQAIQLDELIKWIKAQAKVDPNEGSH